MRRRRLGYVAILGIALVVLSACAAVPYRGGGAVYRAPADTPGGGGSD